MMDATYEEIREGVQDRYEGWCVHDGESIEYTFYAYLGDHECWESFTKSEEVCIYVIFALLFAEKGHDISFLADELRELLKEEHFAGYKEEMGEEYDAFLQDVEKARALLVGIDAKGDA